MPHAKKKYNKYRKYNGRIGYLNCGQMVINDATRALAMAKYVKGLVNVEFKQHNINRTSAAMNTTFTQSFLTNLSQGGDDTERDGNSLRMKSIQIKGFVKQNASAAQTLVRLLVVHDKQTNQALFTPADLLFDVTPGDAIISARNIDNMKRFHVLWDKVITLDSAASGTKTFSFYKKLNIAIRYDENAGDITDLTQSSLNFMQVSDEATNTPTITVHIRLRYIDN